MEKLVKPAIKFTLLMVNSCFLMLFIIGCNPNTKKHKIKCNECLITWKKDSLGCNNLRSKNLFLKINEGNVLIGLTKKEIIDILGKPNMIDDDIFEYYIKSICENNALVVDSDKCYVNLIFANDSLTKVEYPCE